MEWRKYKWTLEEAMLCAEEGAGTEAWGGCCQWPGSAHSWMKRFHVPPPSPQLPLITAASTPAHPPFAPCSSISPLGVFRGGRGGTAAPRVLLGCCPMDFQPHGLPAPRMLTLCLQPPRLPPLCSLPYAACVCPRGPGLASLSPFNPKGRAGHLWAGGANKGAGKGSREGVWHHPGGP